MICVFGCRFLKVNAREHSGADFKSRFMSERGRHDRGGTEESPTHSCTAWRKSQFLCRAIFFPYRITSKSDMIKLALANLIKKKKRIMYLTFKMVFESV